MGLFGHGPAVIKPVALALTTLVAAIGVFGFQRAGLLRARDWAPFAALGIPASVIGGLIDLPAGEVRAAFGASFRENDFDYHVDKLEQVQNIADLPAGLFGSGSTSGRIRAYEVYGELLVPVLNDLPLVRQLDLDLGYRYSRYTAIGGLGTYKIMGDWEVNRFLRFRGGYNLATRAPNVGEMFQADTTTVAATSTPREMRRGPRRVTSEVFGVSATAVYGTFVTSRPGCGASPRARTGGTWPPGCPGSSAR